MKKVGKIPTFTGLILLVLALVAAVFLIRYRAIFRIGASPEATPKDIKISNVSDSSFTVSWLTDAKTSGFVRYGTNQANLSQVAAEESDQPSTIHTIALANLTPSTIYYFSIGSSGNLYDDNGIPYRGKTGPALNPPIKASLVSGTVVDASGNPAKQALVFITVGESSPLSTLTSETGNWAIPITLARTTDLTSYAAFDPQTTLAQISVFGTDGSVAAATTFPAGANPTPQIVLGQNEDFRNAPSQASSSGTLPQSNVGLPSPSTPSSLFQVGTTTPTTQKTVTLKSVEEGEVITTTKPNFFGNGPTNTTITIKVESEVQVTSLKIGASGSWSWTPPKGLAPGTHKITITWKDASGILRALTRDFVVTAAEGPAFVATASASPISTPKASTTPAPTLAPLKTATPKATATASATPATGSLTPTLLLFIMGLGAIAVSLFVWKKSNA